MMILYFVQFCCCGVPKCSDNQAALFSPKKKYNFGYFFKATQLKKTDFPRINLNKIMQKTIHNKKISVTRRYSTCPILGVIEGQFPRAVKSPKTVQSSRSDM